MMQFLNVALDLITCSMRWSNYFTLTSQENCQNEFILVLFLVYLGKDLCISECQENLLVLNVIFQAPGEIL